MGDGCLDLIKLLYVARPWIVFWPTVMAIQDELRHLESYLIDEFEKGHKISDLCVHIPSLLL